MENEKTEETPGPSPIKSYFQLWTHAKTSDTLLRIAGTIAYLAVGAGLPVMTIVFGDFVNDFNGWGSGGVSPDSFKDAVNKNALYLVYIFIAKFTAAYFGSMLYNVTASRIARRVRLRYVERIMHQPIAYFDRCSAASTSTNLTSDVNHIELGLGEKSGIVFQAISMLLVSFGIALSKNWKLTLVCMTSVPFVFLVVTPLASVDTKIEGRIKAIYSEASTVVEEALGSIANITALGASEKIMAHFATYVKKVMGISWVRGLIWATIVGMIFASVHSVYALCLFYGAKLAAAGEIPDGGTVLIVMFCCILASQSFGMLTPVIPDLIRAGVSARRVLSIINQKVGDSGDKACLSVPSVVGCIQLRDVTFAYPTRPSLPVLDNVTLDIPAGKITAVVGTSGSGKSTLVALLEQWYSPQQGSITLDGEDMERYSTSTWRDAIGLVQQEPMLFNDTIEQNILNGYHGGICDGLTEEEKHALVVEAAKKADAHYFISALPDGYRTRVGERGDRLSGGEKQRIALARAIVSNPKILLLDEVTSSLDPESESVVQRAIDAASKHRTILQISHSLATIRHAHHIAVMNKGSFVEEGSHHGLMQLGGLYARLVRAQRMPSHHKPATAPKTEESGPASPSHLSTMDQATATTPTEKPTPAAPELSLHSKSVTHRRSLLPNLAHLLTTYPCIAPPAFAGLIGAIGIGATFPLTAFLYSKLITVFQLQGTPDFTSRANFYALMFFVLALSEMALYWIVYYFFSMVSVTAELGYRPDALRATLKQDSAFFQAPGHASGALMTMLAIDAESIGNMLGGSVPIITYHVLNITGCAVMSLAVYWKLGLISALVCLPLYVVAGAGKTSIDNKAGERCERFFLESARFVGEAVGSVKTVQALRLEEKVVRDYGGRLQAAVRRSTRGRLMAFMFWYGGKLLAEGELSVGDYFIIYMAAMFGGQGAGFAFGYFADLAKAKMALNRLFYLLESKPPINSTKGIDTTSLTAATKGGGTAIEFRDISFSYPFRPEVPILQNLNLKIARGENVCLVGRSGCGKSTVISLVERFYDTTTGDILIDNTPLTLLDINKYRQKLALVSQETVLYQCTIRDNLLLGVADAASLSDGDIETACRTANIHDFIISLPDGYETNCGPRGAALSGGQRQRIAIARALLRNPEVLLLDEATSALDAESKVLFREALEKAGKGRTTVAVAHHVEVMKAADRVILIEQGRVAEEGSFVDLVEKKGPFWEFLRSRVFVSATTLRHFFAPSK
ncbi:ABC multidrug transporter Mdr1 [Immersiella caudata]|uniref:ABC multidrug transporter Mdr1 n=1 Tax=Immersiella caudata TaxID=314043 RepID=A0AA39T0H0_9PEZI|nr:ABC multidrug transporter Mdr1 [Immersiella caudata]